MTVREIYERGIKGLPPIDQLRLATLILEQLTGPQSVTDVDLSDQIRKHTLSNDLLMKMAQTHSPPQSWWQQDDDPTVACEGR